MDPAWEQLIRAGYAAFAAGDLDTVMDIFAPDVSMVNPEYALEDGVREGRESFRMGFQSLQDQFEFDSIDIEEVIEGSEVAVVMVHIHARGRHSGVPMDQRFAHVWHTREGQPFRFEWFLTREEALAATGL